MIYKNIVEGIFIERPNRFIAIVEMDGDAVKVHVKNTGRCRELLIPGVKVFLEDFQGRMGSRKLRYSLIAVEKENLLINMDSQAPNKIVEEGLLSGKIKLETMGNIKTVNRERTFGNSRFDFYIEDEDGKKAFAEVKGVTLEVDGECFFPDAPTERGIKHIKELEKSLENGYLAYVIFVIQIEGMKSFQPNDKTHKAFGDALRHGQKSGVHIVAYGCNVSKDMLEIKDELECNL